MYDGTLVEVGHIHFHEIPLIFEHENGFLGKITKFCIILILVDCIKNSKLACTSLHMALQQSIYVTKNTQYPM